MKMKKLILCLVAMTGMLTLSAQRAYDIPFPILGGELSNSAATSVADIDAVMPRMRTLGLRVDGTHRGQVRLYAHRPDY